MGFSPLANMKRRIPDIGRSDPRNQPVSGLGLHHNAGVNAFGTATSPGRVVSANYWITNEGDLLPNVDESRRAWTSGMAGYPAGAAADHRNITVEISNSPEGVASGNWAISNAAMNTLIRLIADVYKRYKLGPVRRGANKGVGVHQDWVPTACPGGYIMTRMGSIITQAESLRSGAANEIEEITIEEDDDMKPTVHVRTEGNAEWMRAHPEIGRDLAAGKSRKDGKVTVFRGYEVTADSKIGTAWARTHALGSGNETSRTNRSGYIEIQKQAERLSLAIAR